jgi:hypothetical protein
VTVAATPRVIEATDRLRQTMSLEEVTSAAALQTRVDRKYLMPVGVFELLVECLGQRMAVLEIQGRRLFSYESVYFDTPQLAAYHQHAHQRRRRVKVRTRTYLDSGDCLLEIKVVGAHGETIKTRHPHPVESRHELDERARTLVTGQVGSALEAAELAPVITTAYRRATLIDPVGGSRLTCDIELDFRGPSGTRSGPPGEVLVESKAVGAAVTPADRVLYRLGQRPVSLSKYCVGMALLDTSLPANKWNRELRLHFGWQPARRTDA